MRRATRFLVLVMMTQGCGAKPVAPPTTAPVNLVESTRSSDTGITANLDAPLRAGESVAWCATMQVAWSALGQRFGGPVTLTRPSPTATALSMGQFPLAWVDQSAVVAEAGEVTDRWVRDVRKVTAARLGPAFEARLVEDLAALPRPAVGAYAAMRAAIAYRHPFSPQEVWFNDPEDGSDPKDDRVTYAGFGIERFQGPDSPDAPAASQVKVLWHTPFVESGDEPEYVVEIEGTTPGQRLILSRIADPHTLREAITTTMARVWTPNTRPVDSVKAYRRFAEAGESELTDELVTRMLADLAAGDRLGWMESITVPVVDIDATASFDELLGTSFASPEALRPFFVELAKQRVRFRMDENGVTLASEAAVGGLFGGGPREFDFTKPFLALLVYEDAPWPYFAAWVGDGRFLVPAPADGKEESGSNERSPTTLP